MNRCELCFCEKPLKQCQGGKDANGKDICGKNLCDFCFEFHPTLIHELSHKGILA